MEPLALLQRFVSAYGPPGQEDEIRQAVQEQVRALDLHSEIDAKGNLLVQIGEGDPDVVVTAHMDEIAMHVRGIEPDGRLRIGRLGGLHPWKLGEGPVDVLTEAEAIPGVLGFGGIHTEDPSAPAVQARDKPVTWEMARVFTGLTASELKTRGVRPGTRVVVARTRRTLRTLGQHVSGHFLDDRADLVSWLLALRDLREVGRSILFAATAAEEVGGEGALFLLHRIRPAVCIALELGANVPDAPVKISATPTVWAIDGYAATSARDLELVAHVGDELGMDLQYQAFSRGGSDASCAASQGLCARPITLGLPIENSHGYEVMHRDAMEALARLTVALLRRL
jgi:putative aminopeptidase FrvX